MDGGIYQLLLHLPAARRLRVGALGELTFAAGCWVYTGSMVRGLHHRIARHRAVAKPLRWHIDYLTVAAPVAAVRAWPLADTPDQECATHAALLALPGVDEPIPRFGSSDCRCRSHLAHLGATDDPWRAPLGLAWGEAISL